jgi:hypothetical protein
MCILLRGDNGEDSWRGRRCVEILGYHYKAKEKHMLFLLHLENLKTNNYLDLLHTGNTTLEVVAPSLSLQHQDEPTRSHILKSVYGKAFEYSGAGSELWQKKGLSPWDSLYTIKKERVTIWPKADPTATLESFEIVYPENLEHNNFVPFTIWRLGPFTKKGAVAIALKLTFEGDSYDKIVLDQPHLFSVDGPEPLLSTISHSYIPFHLDKDVQQKAKEWLGKFRNYMSFSEGYDVIIIKPPYADKVIPLKLSSIVRAPIQPKPAGVADRFITANPWFTMTLRYRKDRVNKIIEQRWNTETK